MSDLVLRSCNAPQWLPISLGVKSDLNHYPTSDLFIDLSFLFALLQLFDKYTRRTHLPQALPIIPLPGIFFLHIFMWLTFFVCSLRKCPLIREALLVIFSEIAITSYLLCFTFLYNTYHHRTYYEFPCLFTVCFLC